MSEESCGVINFVECGNFAVCGIMSDEKYLDRHSGTCFQCAPRFGQILDCKDGTCFMCEKEAKLYVLPRCQHAMCVSCTSFICFYDRGVDVVYKHFKGVENKFTDTFNDSVDRVTDYIKQIMKELIRQSCCPQCVVEGRCGDLSEDFDELDFSSDDVSVDDVSVDGDDVPVDDVFVDGDNVPVFVPDGDDVEST
jgi:hypothetical protein